MRPGPQTSRPDQREQDVELRRGDGRGGGVWWGPCLGEACRFRRGATRGRPFGHPFTVDSEGLKGRKYVSPGQSAASPRVCGAERISGRANPHACGNHRPETAIE